MATVTKRPKTSIHDRQPENMSTAVVAKCHCTNMLHLLANQSKDIAAKKKLWTRRLRMNHAAINRFATQGS